MKQTDKLFKEIIRISGDSYLDKYMYESGAAILEIYIDEIDKKISIWKKYADICATSSQRLFHTTVLWSLKKKWQYHWLFSLRKCCLENAQA